MGCGASKQPDAPTAAPPDANKPVSIKDIPAVPDHLPSLTAPDDYVAEDISKIQSELDDEMDKMLRATEIKELKEEQAAAAKEIFEKYDLDGSGQLEAVELHSCLQKLGLDIAEDQFATYAKAILKSFDKDKNANLDLKEFKRFYSQCLATEEVRAAYAEKLQGAVREDKVKHNAKVAFKKYDVDSSGTINAAELGACMRNALNIELTDEQWTAMAADALKRGDKDGNGTFDFPEFLNLYTKCLTSPKVKAKYAEKVQLRFADGKWSAE